MSINELPERFNPVLLCRQAPAEGSFFQSAYRLGDLKNFPHVIKEQPPVTVKLSVKMGVDEQGLCIIEGKMYVTLEMVCQRCLEKMSQLVDVYIRVSPVSSLAEERKLPADIEPLWMVNEEVILAGWIAEELHLALPLVPRHDSACQVGRGSLAAQASDETEPTAWQLAKAQLTKLKQV